MNVKTGSLEGRQWSAGLGSAGNWAWLRSGGLEYPTSIQEYLAPPCRNMDRLANRWPPTYAGHSPENPMRGSRLALVGARPPN